jgi:oligosaccharide repeat unit polymerase
MNDKTRRKQKKLFYSALGIAILFLIPITVARFFYLGKEVGINSLINYSGSQFSNFNNFFNRIPNPEKYGSINNIFPIFNFDFNKNDDIFLENWKDRVWAYGIDINVFSTFIGSFYVNIGKIGTFLLGIVFFLLGSFISRDSTQVSLSKIILITLFAQIILHGLFYYKLAYTISNIYMIITILLAYNFRKT